ncbi:MAG: NAD-dependent epimerase/dehydratase family protein, partial [Candidatus Eremiobacterota bacterium]
MRFVWSSPLGASADDVYAWHERPGAFERLLPPWTPARTVSTSGGLGPGGRRLIELKVGPLKLHWDALHTDCTPGRMFQDIQMRGPMAHWTHTHRFVPRNGSACVLQDEVDCSLPGGWPVDRVFQKSLERALTRVFRFRHGRTRLDLARHAGRPPLRVALTGGSGFLGSNLASFLESGGHSVLRLVRRRCLPSGSAFWDPRAGEIDAARLEGLDAVIHLAGESVAQWWTPSVRREILDSRVRGTALLAGALSRLSRPPRTLVSASAIGYYGSDRTELDEDSPAGRGYLARVCAEWEAAARAAAEAGIRVV